MFNFLFLWCSAGFSPYHISLSKVFNDESPSELTDWFTSLPFISWFSGSHKWSNKNFYSEELWIWKTSWHRLGHFISTSSSISFLVRGGRHPTQLSECPVLVVYHLCPLQTFFFSTKKVPSSGACVICNEFAGMNIREMSYSECNLTDLSERWELKLLSIKTFFPLSLLKYGMELQ